VLAQIEALPATFAMMGLGRLTPNIMSLGGVTVSTLLTLLVVPCVYLIVDVLSLRMRRFLTGAATGH